MMVDLFLSNTKKRGGIGEVFLIAFIVIFWVCYYRERKRFVFCLWTCEMCMCAMFWRVSFYGLCVSWRLVDGIVKNVVQRISKFIFLIFSYFYFVIWPVLLLILHVDWEIRYPCFSFDTIITFSFLLDFRNFLSIVLIPKRSFAISSHKFVYISLIGLKFLILCIIILKQLFFIGSPFI